MNIDLYLFGFAMGTFKFLFSQWLAFGYANQLGIDVGFTGLFLSTMLGAWFSMTIFYWSSEYFMERSKRRRLRRIQAALDKGKLPPGYKKFTRINKLVVWIKQNIGIVGVTIIAPLFLSIPIGSIVCAKFYGREKITFPLMMLFSAIYAAVMALIIEMSVIG